jgi:hypothetical protein
MPKNSKLLNVEKLGSSVQTQRYGLATLGVAE